MNKKTAIVTGATGGMGREIVADLARTHKVIALGRNTEILSAMAAKNVDCVQIDIVKEHNRFLELAKSLETIDVLVHAAAIGGKHTLENSVADDWANYFASNVTAAALLTKECLPKLRQSQGTIIFIGSGASTKPAPGAAVYAATKHALKAVADTLRIEEEANRVRVVTLAPGQTDTAMLKGMIPPAHYNAHSYIQPQSIARAVRFVVDAPGDAHITDLSVRPRAEIKNG